MGDVLVTFTPDNGGAVQTAWVAAIIALGALAGMVFMLRKKESGRSHNQNMLAAMLLFFVGLIGGGVAFFSWWNLSRATPVSIYRSAVETPYGKVAFRDIKDAYIYADQEPSLVNPNRSVRTTKILIIEERNGKTHALSEKDYPVQEILASLKSTFSNWQEKQQ